MVCVKLAVYLLYGVAICVWLSEETRGLALAALRSHVRRPRVKATWLDTLREVYHVDSNTVITASQGQHMSWKDHACIWKCCKISMLLPTSCCQAGKQLKSVWCERYVGPNIMFKVCEMTAGFQIKEHISIYTWLLIGISPCCHPCCCSRCHPHCCPCCHSPCHPHSLLSSLSPRCRPRSLLPSLSPPLSPSLTITLTHCSPHSLLPSLTVALAVTPAVILTLAVGCAKLAACFFSGGPRASYIFYKQEVMMTPLWCRQLARGGDEVVKQ